MTNSSKFFCNKDCEYFPCHKGIGADSLNCMFCYCPLYNIADCPGSPEYLPNGVKDCSNCTWPHMNYDAVITKVKESIAGMKTVTVVQCKMCKHFQKDTWGEFDSMPIIVAHDICTFWGNGCKTHPEGYCFAGELKEDKS